MSLSSFFPHTEYVAAACLRPATSNVTEPMSGTRLDTAGRRTRGGRLFRPIRFAGPWLGPRRLCGLFLLVSLWLWLAVSLPAKDIISFDRDGEVRTVEGRVEVEAQDGGLLVLARDGVLWAIQPQEIRSHKTDEAAFDPYQPDDLAAAILAKLPAGFRVHQTTHYVICYNTTREYAQWCGALYERLYQAFYNYWNRRGMELKESPPLVAVVFQDRASYEVYGRAELGSAISAVIGYYSLETNRIAMYDLTGVDDLRNSRNRIPTAQHINQLLSQPQSERTVATIIHEATHQLAFNSGLQTRFADIPVWLSEGIAIYFETPDLRSKKGWSKIGEINGFRLQEFVRFMPQRPADSLTTLLGSDERFRDTAAATPAYAESWALCYFLIRTRPKEFAEYLRLLREKAPLVPCTAQQRLADFRAAFGVDLGELNTDFIRHMHKLH